MEEVDRPDNLGLPPDVLAWLRELRPDEVGLLRDAIRLVSAISTVGKLAKWAIIVVAGVIVGVGGVGESLLKIVHWLWPPVGPKQ